LRSRFGFQHQAIYCCISERVLVTNADETLSIPRLLVGATPQHLQTVPRPEMSDMVKVLEDWENRQ
jgi:hypothetical protein